MRAMLLGMMGLLLLGACAAGDPVLFISRAGNGSTGSEEETTRYYGNLKTRPLENEKTLKDWLGNKQERCFQVDPDNVIEAAYYNGADLGLGRQIYCVKCPPTHPRAGVISCGVSNHGVPQGLDAFTFDFANGVRKEPARDRRQSINASLDSLETFLEEKGRRQLMGEPPLLDGIGFTALRGASVVFDYDPNPTVKDERVRMYIYDANKDLLFSGANRSRTAEGLIPGLQLDGEGEALNARVKFMRNCLSCHGGRYDASADRILGATFLDFDAVLFNYSDDPTLPAAKPAAARCGPSLTQLRKLNALVKEIAQGTGATMVANRIDENLKNDFFLDQACRPKAQGYVPDGWNRNVTVASLGGKPIKDRDFFQVVVHKYCASCHFSQTPVNNLHRNPNPLTFADSEQWFGTMNMDLRDRDGNPVRDRAALIRQEVCGATDMPHAEVTRNNMKRDSLAFAYVCNSEAP